MFVAPIHWRSYNTEENIGLALPIAETEKRVLEENESFKIKITLGIATVPD
jgi:hypothetical protein